MRVVTSSQMKQIEQESLKYDLTYYRLMENAGSAAAAFIRRTFRLEGINCIVVCGRGNNGGDGFVAARKLFEEGANVLAVLVDGPPTGEDAAAMYSTAKMIEIPIIDFAEGALNLIAQADIIIDALYGTGFHGELSPTARAACVCMNEAIAAIVSLDVPSGVNCDTGEADPDAVRADFTVVFDSHKPAHVLASAAPWCGVIELLEIGIPNAAREGLSRSFGQLSLADVFRYLPVRDPDSNKGTHGRVLCLCGSARFRGAASMAVLGALRCGAGAVTLAATEAVCAAVSARILETTFLPLPATETGSVSSTSARQLTRPLRRSSAVLFGCGLGNSSDTAHLLQHVLHKASGPVIIDADGINTLAENIHILQEASCPIIITPHPGEMARLTGNSIPDVQADRTGAATRFAQQHGVVVVLKGRETVIAETDGSVLVNPTGNAGLAKGGSGDILAGMITAFCAQGLDPFHASACAAYLHGLAADRTAARLSQYAMLPSELLDDLAHIFAENNR